MKLYITILLSLFVCVFFKTVSVNAFEGYYKNIAGCTYSEMSSLKEAAASVQFYYDYDKKNNITLTASNLSATFFILDELNNKFTYNGNREIPSVQSISGYFDDQVIKLIFKVSSDSNCSNQEILVRSLKIPRYNSYYGHPKCEGINPDAFSLCSKWYPTNVDLAFFEGRVDEYKKSLEKKEEVKEETVSEKTLFDLLLNNYYYILGFVLLSSIVGIVVLSIREKKRRVV